MRQIEFRTSKVFVHHRKFLQFYHFENWQKVGTESPKIQPLTHSSFSIFEVKNLPNAKLHFSAKHTTVQQNVMHHGKDRELRPKCTW
jgi:hypothetical protein